MIQTKRIEIVIDQAHTPGLISALRKAGAPAYTLIRDVQGSGDRGDRGGDHLGDVFRNCYVVMAVDPEKVEKLLEQIKPWLVKYGGMCLVSDASMLPH